MTGCHKSYALRSETRIERTWLRQRQRIRESFQSLLSTIRSRDLP